jgi:signal peptidase I
MVAWIFLLLLLLEQVVFFPRLFKKAGLEGWHGAVPIWNLYALTRAVKRPWYWALFLLVPGVNVIMLSILQVELTLAFGKRSVADQFTMLLLPWYGLYAIWKSDATYVGPRDWTVKRKGAVAEWKEAILWAVVVASTVRALVFEAFTIPTGSMEGSMLVGDYLYVSKVAYGPKVPQTPFNVPFMHNRMPRGMTPSYTDWLHLPYYRLPGWRGIERYDAVVFNFPAGDSIVVDESLSGHDYYGLLRKVGVEAAGSVALFDAKRKNYTSVARKHFEKNYGIAARPLDKREHYVKRVVGLPGDELEIRDGELYLNGVLEPAPAGRQFEYNVHFKGRRESQQTINAFGLTNQDFGQSWMVGGGTVIRMALTEARVMDMRNSDLVEKVERVSVVSRRGTLAMYPNVLSDEFDQWDPDNYGPIVIPSKGMTVELTPRNLDVYRRVIGGLSAHDLVETKDLILIDGVETTSYTFDQDYYWMMGDNRHRSADSRMWGFVPEDHVVGRASFIWMSRQTKAQHGEAKIRWDRVFSFVR